MAVFLCAALLKYHRVKGVFLSSRAPGPDRSADRARADRAGRNQQ